MDQPTDRRTTDRQTAAKYYAIPSSKGGGAKNLLCLTLASVRLKQNLMNE